MRTPINTQPIWWRRPRFGRGEYFMKFNCKHSSSNLTHTSFLQFVVQVEDACDGHVYDRAIVRIIISVDSNHSTLLTNRDVGIPADSNIGYQVSTVSLIFQSTFSSTPGRRVT